MVRGPTDTYSSSSESFPVGGPQTRAHTMKGSTRGDPAQQEATSKKADNTVQQALPKPAKTSTNERKLKQLLGTSCNDRQTDTATDEGILDRMGMAFRNAFTKSESPRSSPTSSPRNTQSVGASLQNAQFTKKNTIDVLKQAYAEGTIGNELKDKLRFCKELLKELGNDAGKFVREKSEEMYKQVTNAQSIGRANTAYSALATAYLEQKLNFAASQGFKNLQNAVKNPDNKDMLVLANDLWKEIISDLKNTCLADPELKLFLEQLYSSHLEIFTRGADGNEDLKDTQMKNNSDVTAEQCAEKMVVNTLFLRVVNPAITNLRVTSENASEKSKLGDLAKIFQNGTNLYVKSADAATSNKEATALIKVTQSFIEQHKDEILTFGRMFAPGQTTPEKVQVVKPESTAAEPTPATASVKPIRTPPSGRAPAPPTFDQQLTSLSGRIAAETTKDEFIKLSKELNQLIEKVDVDNKDHLDKLETLTDELVDAKENAGHPQSSIEPPREKIEE